MIRPQRSLWVAVVPIILACGDDSCIVPPCAAPLAIDLAVSATNAPAGITGLTFTVGGAVSGGGFCQKAPVTHCYVQGPAGVYELELSAPGYAQVKIGVTVNGTETAACGCPRPETQLLSVVMQPTGSSTP